MLPLSLAGLLSRSHSFPADLIGLSLEAGFSCLSDWSPDQPRQVSLRGSLETEEAQQAELVQLPKANARNSVSPVLLENWP